MDKYIVLENYTLREVMEKLEENHQRVVLVKNEIGKIVGILSQGDIIRALLSGSNVYTQAQTIMRPSFIYLTKYDLSKAYHIFKEKKVSLVPVLNEDAELVSVITLNEIFHYLEGKDA